MITGYIHSRVQSLLCLLHIYGLPSPVCPSLPTNLFFPNLHHLFLVSVQPPSLRVMLVPVGDSHGMRFG